MSTLNHQYLIDKILAMGCSPLPVAPQMLSANGSPSKITGKNPSYIDVLNRHYIVSHKQFQNKQPSSSTLTSWFSNPQNGIGILCSDTVVCIDIDSKNFDSIDACNVYYTGLLESHPILKSAWNERSQSGGYHIIIRLKSPKTFTNFSDRPGGKQIGEVLGYGRFVVLAPTIGPSGNPYTCLNFPDELPEIERLEAIGVYSTKSNSDINIPTIPKALEISSHPEVMVRYSQTTVGTNNVPKKTKKSLSPLQDLADFPLYLPDLISERSRAILNGDIFAEQGERSDCLITLLNELAGWLNWGKKNQVNIVDNLRELSHIAGGLLGLDSDRIDRIIDSIDWGRAYPSAHYKGGDDACWKKVAQVHSRKGAKVKNPASTFLQRAVEEIYGDDFLICCTGKLYRWVGTHYEYLPEAEEIGRIRNYCNEYCVTKNDQITFPYAKPKVVKEVWEWVKMVNPVSPERLRPKGINCLNGVLEIHWVDNKPIISLEEHNPYKHFFINPPQILYNPDADLTG